MKLNFTLSEFNITGEPIPEPVCDKILQYHIKPMQPIRERLGAPIWPSAQSGYRPEHWELTHGRSGQSEHVFDEKGAVDWTSDDLDELEHLIIKCTDYTRIARYDTFLHCDYKPTERGKRQYFTSDSNSNWVFQRYL